MPSIINAIKTLGLNCLSWAFFHITVDEEMRKAITDSDKGTFLDVLDVLVRKYYDVSELTNSKTKSIDWQRDSLGDWNNVLQNAGKKDGSKFAGK